MGADELERRLADLTRQEVALRRIVAEVESQRAAPGAAPAELAAAQKRIRELEAQLAELQRPPEPKTVSDTLEVSDTVVSEPPLVPESPPSAPESQIARLERAIAEAHAEGRPEAEEWAFYLPHLREHARPDGSLPPQFDALVESVFGEL